MKILLDTHAWLWAVAAPERLGPRARKLLEDGGNVRMLSAASSWEIAIKCALGKLKLPESPRLFVPKRMARDGIAGLPVEHRHALEVADLPDHHRDPFDRMLIAQARVERLPILTHDAVFKRYRVEVLRADE